MKKGCIDCHGYHDCKPPVRIEMAKKCLQCHDPESRSYVAGKEAYEQVDGFEKTLLRGEERQAALRGRPGISAAAFRAEGPSAANRTSWPAPSARASASAESALSSTIRIRRRTASCSRIACPTTLTGAGQTDENIEGGDEATNRQRTHTVQSHREASHCSRKQIT